MWDGSSKLLVQQVGDGSIIKRFEKTPPPVNPKDVVCPHFLELKWAYGCPYNCAWCYLKGTLRLLPTKTKPVLKSRRKISSHLKAFFNATSGGYPSELLNTGELADSLMDEKCDNPFSEFIISLFQSQKKHKVLFLTKSNNIENLLSRASPQVIVSFSINTKTVAKRWEIGAPSPIKRIEGAEKVARAGYEVRVRLDPIVPIQNWYQEYVELLRIIFKKITPERITLGTLRGLQSTINEARDKSWTRFLVETTNWGKRISFDQRYEVYHKVLTYLEDKYGFSNVALCKETKEMWEKLGKSYKKIKCNCIL